MWLKARIGRLSAAPPHIVASDGDLLVIEEIREQLVECFGVVEIRDVARAGDDREAGIRQCAGKLAGELQVEAGRPPEPVRERMKGLVCRP